MSASLFIIGTPKSGTTSLFYWLADHPAFQPSDPKETFFFMDPEHPLVGRYGRSVDQDGLAEFEQFFSENANAKIRLEGTTHTFYQETARDYLTAFRPQPVIAMLFREPASRLLSSFRFTRDNLANCDSSLTFDQYVDWLLAGKQNELDRFYYSKASLWIAKRELELGKYVVWLDWWAARYPREKLRLVLFEQLRNDPAHVVLGLCQDLGIDPSFYQGFAFYGENATYAVGRQNVHRFIRWLAPMVPHNIFRDQIKALYLQWQDRMAAPDIDYQKGLERMQAYFAPWNRELAHRYRLDLEFWWGEEALNADRIAAN